MTVADHQSELERRLACGLAFSEAEDWINGLDASEDVKAALWLIAWSQQKPSTQRRVAYEALAYADMAANDDGGRPGPAEAGGVLTRSGM